MKVFFYLGAAISAFVGDAVLIRSVLADTDMDPATFVLVSLVSASLIALFLSRRVERALPEPSWVRSLFIVGFAVLFTCAYSYLSLSLGVLILFGTLQVATIMSSIIFKAERLNLSQCFGLGLAMIGWGMLFVPVSIIFDTYTPMMLMVFAGLVWVGYTDTEPKRSSATMGFGQVFRQVVTLTILFYSMALFFISPAVTFEGLVYALVCGLLAGSGYALWRVATNSLAPISTAFAQVTILVISMLLGVVLLNERVSNVELSSASLMLLGIAIYVLARYLSSLRIESSDSISS
jgi:drug/metabolite transporter (DMT)-like permease